MTQPAFLAGAGEKGLVSIVVPAYNRANVIRTTLDSILAQTYGSYEVLVVDDGSKDKTGDVVQMYTDPRIRYFRTTNGGLSAARNYALDQARGEFIAFLDSDDAWSPWKLAAQIELFRRHPDVGLIWTDMSTFIDNPGNVVHDRYIRTYYTAYTRIEIEKALTTAGTLGELADGIPADVASCPYHTGSVFREMFIGSLVHPSTAIVRRDRLRQGGRFDFALTGPGAEDYHFYYKLSEGGPVAFLDAPTAQYRIGDSNALSAATLAQARGNLNVVLHWLDRARPLHPADIVDRRLANSYHWAGKEELFSGYAADARKHLFAALRLQRDAGTLGLYLLSLLPSGSIDVLRKVKHAILGKPRGSMLIHVALLAVPDAYLVHRAFAVAAHVTRIAGAVR